MINPLPRLFAVCSAALLCTWLTAAHAVGTAEAEASARLAYGRFPLVLSANGQWLLYTDQLGRVVRQSSNGAIRQTADLGYRPQSLWLSGDGRTLAFSERGDCAVVATWPLPRRLARRCPEGQKTVQAANGGHYVPGLQALSHDGRRVAWFDPGKAVRVVNLASGKQQAALPFPADSSAARWGFGGRLFEIRFVGTHHLLVVQGQEGEEWEMPVQGSFLAFSLWRIGGGIERYARNTVPSLDLTARQWAYAARSGRLWMASRKGDESWLQQRDWHRCVARLSGEWAIRSEILELAVDPQGRWLAVMPSYNNFVERRGVELYAAATGKWLHTFPLPEGRELRSLQVSPDGLRLFGLTASDLPADGEYQSKDDVRLSADDPRTTGNTLVTLDLAPWVRHIQKLPAQRLHHAACFDQGTAPVRREHVVSQPIHVVDIGQHRRSGLVKLEASFDLDTRQDHTEQFRRQSCLVQPDSGGTAHTQVVGAWDVHHGYLWVDAWNKVLQLVPDSGELLREYPLSRPCGAVSKILFDRLQVVSHQGDTLTLQALVAAGAPRMIILDRRPGYTVYVWHRLDTKLVVAWNHDGNMLVTAYDLDQGREIRGPLPDEARSVCPSGRLSWELTYLGGVRAQPCAQGHDRTVFWDGQQPDAKRPQQGIVQDLGHGKALLRHERGIVWYDAISRRKVEGFQGVPPLAKDHHPGSTAIDARWLEEQRLLFVEVCHAGQWRLNAYKVP